MTGSSIAQQNNILLSCFTVPVQGDHFWVREKQRILCLKIDYNAIAKRYRLSSSEHHADLWKSKLKYVRLETLQKLISVAKTIWLRGCRGQNQHFQQQAPPPHFLPSGRAWWVIILFDLVNLRGNALS